MEVLLIRHGESENNVIAANLKTQYVDSQTHKFDLQEFEKVWLVERLDDPPITARGQRQAGLVAETLSPRVRKHHQLGISEGGRGAVVFVSPFFRTLQTVTPLAQACPEVPVVVRPDIFELGGVYTAVDGKRGGPGECLDLAGMRKHFGDRFNYDAIPKEGKWYTGGWESDAEARTRTKSILQWLKGLATPKESSQAYRLVVLVIHGNLMDQLTKALFNYFDSPDDDIPFMQNQVRRPLRMKVLNASTTSFVINARGQIAVQWVNRINHLGGMTASL